MCTLRDAIPKRTMIAKRGESIHLVSPDDQPLQTSLSVKDYNCDLLVQYPGSFAVVIMVEGRSEDGARVPIYKIYDFPMGEGLAKVKIGDIVTTNHFTESSAIVKMAVVPNPPGAMTVEQFSHLLASNYAIDVYEIHYWGPVDTLTHSFAGSVN